MAPVMDPTIVAYYTDNEGTVHAVCWCTIMNQEELVLACMPNRPRMCGTTRTAANPETVSCLVCLATELLPWNPSSNWDHAE